MIAVTESGTRYEFEWDADSEPSHLRYGRVRKDGAEWEEVHMLTDVAPGGSLVMLLGYIVPGPVPTNPVRRTTRVVEVFG